jgi:hypothetical protein
MKLNKSSYLVHNMMLQKFQKLIYNHSHNVKKSPKSLITLPATSIQPLPPFSPSNPFPFTIYRILEGLSQHTFTPSKSGGIFPKPYNPNQVKIIIQAINIIFLDLRKGYDDFDSE